MDNTYLTLKYNSKSRWLSYWYQISETLDVSPDSVLVVGKGSGITENAIRELSGGKINIVTLDTNYEVCSDVIGDVTELPFESETFDVALCCQVLEHIPFDEFALALNELHRVVRRRVVLSLPHRLKHLKIAVDASFLPFLKDKQIILKNPIAKKHCSSKQHCWEIGRGVSRRDVVRQLSKNFDIEKEFLNEIGCDHRFFILKRKKF